MEGAFQCLNERVEFYSLITNQKFWYRRAPFPKIAQVQNGGIATLL